MPDRPLTLEVDGLRLALEEDGLGETLAAERRRIATELHDSVGQSLYALNLAIEAALGSVGEPAHEQALHRVKALAREAILGVRRAIFELPLPELRARGLSVSIRALCHSFEAEAGIPVTLQMSRLPRVSTAAEDAVFRSAREALINAERHSRAREIRLSLERCDGRLVLEVVDDGVGLGAQDWRDVAGFGLRSLAAEVARAGGRFELEPGENGGTVLRADVPVRRSRVSAT